nr:hypothetical protein Iba_chr04bCG17230 [Ipomoea batatas]
MRDLSFSATLRIEDITTHEGSYSSQKHTLTVATQGSGAANWNRARPVKVLFIPHPIPAWKLEHSPPLPHCKQTKIEESRDQPDTKNKSSLNLVSGDGVKIAADVGGGKIFVRRCRIERSALVFRPCSNSQSSSFAICSVVVQHPTCFCPGSAFVYFSP